MNQDFSTFDAFIASTLGRTIGEGECWDYCNLIWSHLGSKLWTYPPLDPSATNHGIKWSVLNLTARNANIIPGITFIPRLTNVKKGDIVITGNTNPNTYGHGGFAAVDYEGGGSLLLYSQNYSGRFVTLDENSMANFAGAFRYPWPRPTPPITVPPASSFKWVLYARKLRDKRNGN